MDAPANTPPGRTMTRRDCLTWLARASAVPLALHACSLAHAAGAPNLMALKNNSARLLDSPDVILTRTRNGVAALSTFCTHRRNKLEIDGDGEIKCPVHDSIFGYDGQPISGPATKPLTWYATQISDSGEITINSGQEVAQGTWGQLPDWAKPKTK